MFPQITSGFLALIVLSGCACFEGDAKMQWATGALVASGAFDAATTNHSIRNGGREGNPIPSAFVKGGASTHAYALVTAAAFTGAACFLKRRGMKNAWIIPAIGAVGHTGAGIWNMSD